MAENRKPTILVIEDEAIVQMLVVDFLNETGFTTLEATDSRTALPIIEDDGSIDLLITDVGLPGMDGWQLAKLARARHPSIKVLFITGYSSAGDDMQKEAGTDLIVKPFDMGQLAAKVAELLADGEIEERLDAH